MRCKLYKGPMHNKVVDVSDKQLESGFVALMCKDPKSKGGSQNFGSTMIYSGMGFKVVTYQIMIMSGSVGGKKFYGPAVHPDGSLILQYMEKKK